MAGYGSGQPLGDYYDNDLKELISALRPRLVDYLNMMGVPAVKGQKFKCISPDHNDESPSMDIRDDSEETHFHCYSCHVTGGIFHAAHHLENKPISGHDFVEENVYYLADKLGMQYERRELTETQKVQLHLSRLYQTVYRVFTKMSYRL